MAKGWLFIFIILFISGTFFKPVKIQAAKKFTPKSTSTTTGKTSSGGGSIPAIVRYKPDKGGLLLSFSNFNGLASVSYSFTYNTGGLPKGAAGSVTAANNPTSQRELLFGTCSGGVCKYDQGLSNARLVLTAKRTNGTTVTKPYRIKTYK